MVGAAESKESLWPCKKSSNRFSEMLADEELCGSRSHLHLQHTGLVIHLLFWLPVSSICASQLVLNT